MEQFYVLTPRNTALLVIDVQRALFTRPTPVYNAYRMIETINSLITRAHLYGVQRVFIQHSNDSFLKKSTSGWQLHPDLFSPTDHDLTIQKTHGNAFLETSLKDELDTRDIDTLILTGLVSQGCVRATALGGLDLKFKVILVKGAHSNYNKDAEQVIENGERELEGAGVVVLTPEQIDFS